MKDDLIELPSLNEVKELLTAAKDDIASQIDENPEIAEESELLKQVMSIIESKIGKEKSFDKLDLKSKIDIAAHLNLLQSLLEDFFLGVEFDEDLFYSDDEEEFEDKPF